MKKIVYVLILILFGNCSFAEGVTDKNEIKTEIKTETPSLSAPPVWEDYVPFKYHNPRYFKRGGAIAEMAVGSTLAATLWLSPIGVPILVHGVTKMKNRGWYDRKLKFEKYMAESEKIQDTKEKQQYYAFVLQKAGLSEEKRLEQLERAEKRNAKELKKQNKANKQKNIETKDEVL